LGITGYLSAFAAVEEFALQNFPQTRAILRSICPFGSTTRLAPNFHHKHIQPPLAGFCNIPIFQPWFALFDLDVT
jgi:hypothetical protein